MAEEEMKEQIQKISQALLGFNGHDGLLNLFEEHREADERFREDYYNFKRWVLSVFFFLVGSGVITAGIIQLV